MKGLLRMCLLMFAVLTISNCQDADEQPQEEAKQEAKKIFPWELDPNIPFGQINETHCLYGAEPPCTCQSVYGVALSAFRAAFIANGKAKYEAGEPASMKDLTGELKHLAAKNKGLQKLGICTEEETKAMMKEEFDHMQQMMSKAGFAKQSQEQPKPPWELDPKIPVGQINETHCIFGAEPPCTCQSVYGEAISHFRAAFIANGKAKYETGEPASVKDLTDKMNHLMTQSKGLQKIGICTEEETEAMIKEEFDMMQQMESKVKDAMAKTEAKQREAEAKHREADMAAEIEGWYDNPEDHEDL